MSRPISVVIADDQPLFRTGIEMLIESQNDLEMVASVENGREAVDAAAKLHPDVMLMDIRMPVLDGIAAIEQILAEFHQTAPRIVVLTTMRHDEAVARAIRAGASGFVMKDADPEFLLAAIRTVNLGHAVIAPAETFDLIRQFGGRPMRQANEDAIDVLTPREKDIFGLVAKGLSNAEVATTAFVSEATVKTHLSGILAKLRLRGRVQLVTFAWENGLVG